MGEINITSFKALDSGKAEPDESDEVYAAVNYIPEQLLEYVNVNMMFLAPPDIFYLEYKDLKEEVGEEEANDKILYDIVYNDYIRVKKKAKKQVREIAAKAMVRDVWIVVYENDTESYPQILKQCIKEKMEEMKQ